VQRLADGKASNQLSHTCFAAVTFFRCQGDCEQQGFQDQGFDISG
jgi:hypothetical protein